METDPWGRCGLCESNDARVSRSSRGKKSVVGGDAVEGQKLDAGIGNSGQAI